MALEGVHQQQQQQRLQALVAQPIARLPQRHEGLCHLPAIAPAVVGILWRRRSAKPRLRHGFGPVQQLQLGLAVVAGQLLQLIKEPPRACT